MKKKQKQKHKYQAIFLDVDGTLVNNEYGGKISKIVRTSLLKSKSKIEIGIATGRSFERIKFIIDELGLEKPCIVSGGAQVIHPVSKKILWERPILAKDLKIITNMLARLSNKVWVIDTSRELLFNRNASLQKPLSFFIPRIRESQANAVISYLSAIPTLVITKVVAYHPGYVALHITHVQATKQHAVEKAAEFLRVDRKHIIGVGDGYNDFPLFKAAGLKVAVGNAIPELKKMADYVAPSVANDGVAHVIEKFILKN